MTKLHVMRSNRKGRASKMRSTTPTTASASLAFTSGSTPDKSTTSTRTQLVSRHRRGAEEHSSIDIDPTIITQESPMFVDKEEVNSASLTSKGNSSLQTYEDHQIASVFPLLTEDKLVELAEDIRQHGLRSDITLYQEHILDGRNRYRACRISGVQPRFISYDGDDPLAFVLSANLHRRHLSESQRAGVAAKIAKMKNHRPLKCLNSSTSVSQKEAAKRLNVSRSSVQGYKSVERDAPELAKEIDRGGMTVNRAVKAIKKHKATDERARRLDTAPVGSAWDGEFKVGEISQADVTDDTFIGRLSPDCVDLIVTDPPRSGDALRTYQSAAKIAATVLRPGHLMAIYVDKMILPKILSMIGEEGLEYVWIFCVFQPDGDQKVQQCHLVEKWRPVLLVMKPCTRGGEISEIETPWIPDAMQSTRDKKSQEWGQGMELVEHLVKAYSHPGELVLDPFVGGGSVPYVAQMLERKYIAFDIHLDRVRLAKERLGRQLTKRGRAVSAG